MKKDKIIIILNRIVKGICWAFGIYGFVGLFFLFFEKELFLNITMNNCSIDEIIVNYHVCTSLYCILLCVSILNFMEYEFLKKNLYKEYRIKTQKGAIIHDEEVPF